MKWILQEIWHINSSLSIEELRAEIGREVEPVKFRGPFFSTDKSMEGKLTKSGFSLRKMTTGRNACSIKIYGQFHRQADSASITIKFALDTIIFIFLIYGLGFLLTFLGLLGIGILLSDGDYLLLSIALGLGIIFIFFSRLVFRSEMKSSKEVMKNLLDSVHHEKGKYETKIIERM